MARRIRRLMNRRELLKLVAGGAFLLITLRFGAEFSWSRAVAIAFAIFVAVAIFRSVEEPAFTPFRIHIMPNWLSLLQDYDLAPPEKLEKQLETANAEPATQYNVLRDGITLTFLKPDLIYHHGRDEFAKHLDINIPIEGIMLSRKTPNSLWSPRIYFKGFWGSNWELGLILEGGFYRGGVADWKRMQVACFPVGEVACYFLHNEIGTRFWDRYCRSRSDERKSNGWARTDDDLHVISLEHKYFMVQHNEV